MKKSHQNLLKKLSFFIAAILMVSAVWAQQSISGTVLDNTGKPLPGVIVIVGGTTIGTSTDIDGKYTLNVPASAQNLTFSFIGMKISVVAINGQSTIDLTMEPETIGLDEVVAIGYGVQKKASLTGAIGNVKADELLQRPVANTTELLQGQIAGLQTRQTSGLPGADGTTLNVRGFGSPLVLIDGVQGALAQVDPNDIASISVLKDASAAVYGARAGNGVILVTTNRGEDRAAKITYHGTVSFAQPTFLPKHVNATK